MKTTGLTPATIQKIHDTLAQFPEVDKAVLYGSRAKGSARPGSDIDLALFGSQLSISLLGRIDEALNELLLPWRFDLLIHHHVTDRGLLEHIARVGLALYERTDSKTNALPLGLAGPKR